MKERHGIPDARRVEITGALQCVSVTDGEGEVLLYLGTASESAGMTPEQARFIARQLLESAKRVVNEHG